MPPPESPIRSTAREKSVSASPPKAHASRSRRPESAELGDPWRRSWTPRAALTRSLTSRDSSECLSSRSSWRVRRGTSTKRSMRSSKGPEMRP